MTPVAECVFPVFARSHHRPHLSKRPGAARRSRSLQPNAAWLWELRPSISQNSVLTRRAHLDAATSGCHHPGGPGDRHPRRDDPNQYTRTQVAVTSVAAFHALHTANHAKHIADIAAAAAITTLVSIGVAGLPGSVSFPLHCRIRSTTSIFSFSARSANVRNCLAQVAPMQVENWYISAGVRLCESARLSGRS